MIIVRQKRWGLDITNSAVVLTLPQPPPFLLLLPPVHRLPQILLPQPAHRLPQILLLPPLPALRTQVAPVVLTHGKQEDLRVDGEENLCIPAEMAQTLSVPQAILYGNGITVRKTDVPFQLLQEQEFNLVLYKLRNIFDIS